MQQPAEDIAAELISAEEIFPARRLQPLGWELLRRAIWRDRRSDDRNKGEESDDDRPGQRETLPSDRPPDRLLADDPRFIAQRHRPAWSGRRQRRDRGG